MRNEKTIISVSGLHGTGKSTIAKLIADRLGILYYSTGQMFRDLAKEKNMTLEEYTNYVEHHPDIEITTIPGISSITSFASRADVAIDSSFEVSDGTDIRSKIVLKARRPLEIVDSLARDGFDNFIFAERLFSDKERIIKTREDIPAKGNYFSIIYAKKQGKEE